MYFTYENINIQRTSSSHKKEKDWNQSRPRRLYGQMYILGTDVKVHFKLQWFHSYLMSRLYLAHWKKFLVGLCKLIAHRLRGRSKFSILWTRNMILFAFVIYNAYFYNYITSTIIGILKIMWIPFSFSLFSWNSTYIPASHLIYQGNISFFYFFHIIRLLCTDKE